MEKKIKEHIMDDIFCDRPFDEDDWDSFMKNSAFITPFKLKISAIIQQSCRISGISTISTAIPHPLLLRSNSNF